MAEADLSPGRNGKSTTRAELTKLMVFIRKMSMLKASVKALRGLTQLGQLRSGLGYTLLGCGGIAIPLTVAGLQGKVVHIGHHCVGRREPLCWRGGIKA